MGKRELGGGGDFEKTPIVSISAGPGIKFTGKMLTLGREVKVGLGVKWVYDFEIHDTNAPTIIKNDKGGFDEVEVGEFQKVSIFATKLLHGKLSNAKIGEVIEIEYTGKERGKKGQSYHNFIVSVVE